MSKRVTSYELRVTRKACCPFFDESRDFIAPRYTRDWAILNEVKNLANRFKRLATRNPQPATRKGFSLIEMMVVVVIIGITIGGALFFAAGSYRRTSVKNAARDITSLMRMASSKALSERIYYNVVLNRSTGNCYLEKHYPGGGGIWEDIRITTAKEYSDNTFATDSSPGARKKLANVVDIDNINSNTSNVQRIAFTLKETVMGITTDGGITWDSTPDVYSVYLDDKKSGTGNVKYLVAVDKDTARVKIYSSW